ncbi:hypothetical protein [Thalassotalea piscium]|uniref:Uncharacterized protein n=1 Tax=Thalassotalea piscium TaxID=1230533 RepID=A0A7X0NHN0_9GAMM|nr:hypothetical protein [Thalassotalea piscium]MBB6543618.1 hypothetical protein [Thalassotalea piscium]
MTLFSWYLATKQKKLSPSVTEKSSHVEGMWPIAEVRQNTQEQHSTYVSCKYDKQYASEKEKATQKVENPV